MESGGGVLRGLESTQKRFYRTFWRGQLPLAGVKPPDPLSNTALIMLSFAANDNIVVNSASRYNHNIFYLIYLSVRTTSFVLLQTAPTHIHVEDLKEKLLEHVSWKARATDFYDCIFIVNRCTVTSDV